MKEVLRRLERVALFSRHHAAEDLHDCCQLHGFETALFAHKTLRELVAVRCVAGGQGWPGCAHDFVVRVIGSIQCSMGHTAFVGFDNLTLIRKVRDC